jgi:hypothetical protein
VWSADALSSLRRNPPQPSAPATSAHDVSSAMATIDLRADLNTESTTLLDRAATPLIPPSCSAPS